MKLHGNIAARGVNPTAFALAGLFEVELALRSALVVGALSTDAARGSDAPFDPRIHALRRHAGQIGGEEIAAPFQAHAAAFPADPLQASRPNRSHRA